VKYPATLVTTADHDDRVVPAHSFKYAATLQELASGENPLLIRIETNSAHGASGLEKQLETAADIYTFILHNMGLTRCSLAAGRPRTRAIEMAALIEAIAVKRKMFFEFEDAPYHCLGVEISTPTARGGQTLVRIKMRNLLTGNVFDKTFKAGDKFKEPDLVSVPATYLYSDSGGYHFMDQESYETLTLSAAMVGDGRELLVDTVLVDIQKFNGNPIGLEFPPHVELTVTSTEPGVRGDTASGGVTKLATLETGLEIRVPLFIKEGERVKVHTETREFAGRA
jgi:elongation factor P